MIFHPLWQKNNAISLFEFVFESDIYDDVFPKTDENLQILENFLNHFPNWEKQIGNNSLPAGLSAADTYLEINKDTMLISIDNWTEDREKKFK